MFSMMMAIAGFALMGWLLRWDIFLLVSILLSLALLLSVASIYRWGMVRPENFLPTLLTIVAFVAAFLVYLWSTGQFPTE